VELTHSFTVPAPIGETWAHFNDITSVAECFPGAAVTSVEGDDFKGTCKVKLGPIALTYSGTGTFVEKDEDGHRFVMEAKGKDKRGNGTAGATVTATMLANDDSGTDVTVLTDLSITGKPAQFGRGVIQDVSDKLLQQFVACLESKLTGPAEAEPAPAGPEPAAAPQAGTEEPTPMAEEASAAARAGAVGATAGPAAGAAGPTYQPPRQEDNALDLGATVLPVIAKAYWKQGLGALLVLLVLWRLLRRRR